ncbi:hypothetical protein ACFOYW_14275 [Gryllotalpicola reticulitermitis]|uniref:Uncharacterized protein n=1 Tax=Gryllotalpicola reticulitermitis TaxID=1184153 RepID=A0ABV8Q896_9MICO
MTRASLILPTERRASSGPRSLIILAASLLVGSWAVMVVDMLFHPPLDVGGQVAVHILAGIAATGLIVAAMILACVTLAWGVAQRRRAQSSGLSAATVTPIVVLAAGSFSFVAERVITILGYINLH